MQMTPNATIKTAGVTIPLNTVFKTALRSVDRLENILVTVETDGGLVGYGSAAPTAVITGETSASIIAAVEHIGSSIAGMNLEDHELVFQRLNRCIVGNNSAKAAVDMAIYDLLAKSMAIPLYQLLGGIAHKVETDITISLDGIETMVADSKKRISEGFSILKIKVGNDPQLDIERLQQIKGYMSCTEAYKNSFFPGARLAAPNTIRFESADYFEVLQFFLFTL